MINLKDKTILVTGASSGIGRATAILLSNLGANVLISARNEEKLKETYGKLNSNLDNKLVKADLTKKEDVISLISSIQKIDGLIHCCGKVLPIPTKFIKENQLIDVFSVNYFSAVNLIVEIFNHKKFNNNGSIVFISSVSTHHAYFGGAPYISSKSALEGYAKTLALELLPKKIRVNVLQPALVKTSIYEDTINAAVNQDDMDKHLRKYPLGVGEPDDVAKACAFFISDESKWITGSFLKMDGGLTLGFN